MRVLWINQKATLQGGAEQYIYNTADEMKNFDIQSSLLYDANEDVHNEFLDMFDEAFPILNVYDQIINIQPDVIYIHQLDDESIYKEIIKTKIPTVRFFHDHKLFCLREHKYTTLGKKTCTKKLGLGCYGCLGFVNRSNSALGFSIQTLGKLEKLQKVNKELNHFIVASEYMKEHLELHEFDNESITVNPLYAAKKFEYSTNTNFTSNKTLLFVGQLINGKGLDALLKSMHKIDEEYNLVVVGEGKQEEYFKHYCKELKIEHRVTFVGKLNHEELMEYYKRAYCLVVPSRAPETFNLVGIEAQKVGLPVIATAVGGVSQWLKHDLNGLLVSPNDIKDLQEKINLLIEDKKLHQRICFNVLKTSIYEHDSAAHTSLLIETFQNKLGVEHV
ncbi:glycosyltransferase family 4 protein [Poseidonibacter lekithochrous]|uniref:glycosyltransferase family 4 protein n=1 Tax=Poseidonibacter lekithochrous TaxID=1904463 RepID=UPI000D3A9723|nr:glycosyltransferase family 4 protein [Poseidonibacter lekithochrous]